MAQCGGLKKENAAHVGHRWCHAIMALMPDRAAFKSSGQLHNASRGERLDRLRFADAFADCIALSALAMDMVESFSSRKELIWMQNHFKPPRKTRRAKAR